MDFTGLFAFHVSPIELFVRGSLMYWFLLLAFRFVLRRDTGALGIADILLIVLIADASQNAMGGSYDTVAEGVMLVGTLIGWNYLLDWAGYHWKFVQRLTAPAPLLLIDRGRLVARNLRREFLTREDIESQLRLNGIDAIAKVRKAYLESDGNFSVIPFDKGDTAMSKPQKKIPGAS